jgi:uncharacterized protein (TIGR02246 family)
MTEKTAPSVIRIEHVEEAGKVFQDTFNAGDIDGLVSLFEPEAVLVPAPGKVVAGSDALRETFAGVLATGARFEIVKLFSIHRVGDIALATTEWKMASNDADGDLVTVRARPVIVFRQQTDGSWRFLIDNASQPYPALASVTMREDGAFCTVASTHAAATEVDQAQYQASEGPCLDAVDDAIVYAPAFPDNRWPRLGACPTESGVQSAVSYRLLTAAPLTDASLGGSLNSYATSPHAFDVEAREIGLVLAAHASVAASTVHERTALEQLGGQLHEALSSRDVIGQAKGILMERLRITPDDAFDALRRASQRLNLKLREIAQNLVETGEFADDTDRS